MCLFVLPFNSSRLFFGILFFFVATNASEEYELLSAVNRGQLDRVQEFIEGGLDINVVPKGRQDRTPLMEASLTGHADIVKYLLSKGADWTIGEKDGYTPLHGAAFQGRADVASELLKHGVSTDDAHKDGYQSVFRCTWGSERRHADTLAVFLDSGMVDVNIRSQAGGSLLQEALKTTNTRAVKLLLKYNISTDGLSSEEMETVNNIVSKASKKKKDKTKETEF
eukprot:CAMPEP_0196578578 /NCGR_PEP_ID=MMETSP1081-20130531/7450_1 /TAXON_ID=36882 /ORGANISM="Pyramimonas amylifera, Strain CCMP720" /LENGTH=223 /DNA_ID=CAMNT_0041897843 /DNA_START=42 /DNA_END=713 /DNA_ORIENTATION=-